MELLEVIAMRCVPAERGPVRLRVVVPIEAALVGVPVVEGVRVHGHRPLHV